MSKEVNKRVVICDTCRIFSEILSEKISGAGFKTVEILTEGESLYPHCLNTLPGLVVIGTGIKTQGNQDFADLCLLLQNLPDIPDIIVVGEHQTTDSPRVKMLEGTISSFIEDGHNNIEKVVATIKDL